MRKTVFITILSGIVTLGECLIHNHVLNHFSSPNIIMIMADDMGWNDFGFHGQNQIPTPNIDALAYSGVILNKFYTLPGGTASMAALLTGRYPMRMGLQGESISPGEDRHLPSKVRILPQWLKQLGYKTHLVGKWNLGHATKSDTPLSKGFDHFFGIWNKFVGYFDYLTHSWGCPWHPKEGSQDDNDFVEVGSSNSATTSHGGHMSIPTAPPPHATTPDHPWKSFDCHMNGFDLHDGMRPAWEYKGKYITEVFSSKAVDAILSHNKKHPLFMLVSHVAGHTGNNNSDLEVPDVHLNDKEFGYIPDIGRRRYAGVVKEFDASVGKIMKALDVNGLLHNSIVLVMSDNGAQPVGESANKGSNWPFKGMKGTPYEGGVRGTAVLFSPLLDQRGHIYDKLFHITDILPTLVAAAGSEATKSSFMDGVSHWNALKGCGPSERQELLVNIDETANYSSIISNGGRYKLVNGTVHYGHYDGFYGDSGRSFQNPAYDMSKVFKSDAYWAITKTLLLTNLLEKDKCYKLRNSIDLFGKCNELGRASTKRTCKDLCLFDLYEDPCETTDISHQHPEIVEALKLKLKHYFKDLVHQGEVVISPHANPNMCSHIWFPWKDWNQFCNEDPEASKYTS